MLRLFNDLLLHAYDRNERERRSSRVPLVVSIATPETTSTASKSFELESSRERYIRGRLLGDESTRICTFFVVSKRNYPEENKKKKKKNKRIRTING